MVCTITSKSEQSRLVSISWRRKKPLRVIAKEFGVSKSTVHKDLTERLPEINPDLANEVKEILDYHKSIRHLRGGEATKLKYKKDEILEGEPVQQP